MWFFAILVVLLMGGIAAVAAGRGTPMAEAEPDRLVVALPADRPLGAEDLRRVRFPLALRGYRMADVDALLDRLAREREVAAERPTDGPAAAAETSDAPADVRGDGHPA